MRKNIISLNIAYFCNSMKKVFSKITSFILACFVLLSTLSFTVEKHYCGRFLVDVAVFSKAKDCGMNMMSHSDEQHTEAKKSPCCKDQIIVIEGQDELKTSFDQIDIPEQIVITSFFYSYVDLFSIKENTKTDYVEYAPPELVCDILLLHETYLI